MKKNAFNGKKPLQTVNSLRCPTCAEDMTKATPYHQAWPATGKVYHCTGGTGFGCEIREPHHCRMPTIPCWKCFKTLGCLVCLKTGAFLSEAMCANCLVWSFEQGLVEHGPIANDSNSVRRRGGRRAPELKEYPLEWQLAYDTPAAVVRIPAPTFGEPRYVPNTWMPGGGGSWLIVDDRGAPQPARRYAAELRIQGKPIPPRPEEAKDFELFNQAQIRLFQAQEAGEFQDLTLGEMVRKLVRVMDTRENRG